MTHKEMCMVCDGEGSEMQRVADVTIEEEKDETSFAALLALVPAMTMTLFNLMGLI